MGKKSRRKKFEAFVGTREIVSLRRPFPGGGTLEGFVLGTSNELVLFHQTNDFDLDGYAAVRLCDVSKYRSGKCERAWERMLASEMVLEKVGISYEVDLKDMRSLLKSLQQIGKNIIVECESKNEDEDEFYIGKIVKVGNTKLWFIHFDSLGNWEEEGVKVPLDEITKVRFETRYVNVFSKYLPILPEIEIHD